MNHSDGFIEYEMPHVIFEHGLMYGPRRKLIMRRDLECRKSIHGCCNEMSYFCESKRYPMIYELIEHVIQRLKVQIS